MELQSDGSRFGCSQLHQLLSFMVFGLHGFLVLQLSGLLEPSSSNSVLGQSKFVGCKVCHLLVLVAAGLKSWQVC